MWQLSCDDSLTYLIHHILELSTLNHKPQIYDATTGLWCRGADMTRSRSDFGAETLANDRILVAGGAQGAATGRDMRMRGLSCAVNTVRFTFEPVYGPRDWLHGRVSVLSDVLMSCSSCGCSQQ